MKAQSEIDNRQSTIALTPQQIFRKKAAGESLNSGEEQPLRRHLIAVRCNNTIGALNRVANLFSQRGFNLESVAVGETDDPTVSRMTLVTTGTTRKVEQVLLQLHNLVDTLEVDDLTSEEHVERELCLLKSPLQRRDAGRDQGPPRHLPRQGRRHHPAHDDLRAHRPLNEDQRLYRHDARGRRRGDRPERARGDAAGFGSWRLRGGWECGKYGRYGVCGK